MEMMEIASQGRGAKTKGANFERKTAKALTTWWGNEHPFHRTPGSGSLHWSAENNVAGDIVVAASAKFPFVVECKHHEGNWTIESVLLNKHDIKNWWSQVITDSRRVKRVPLLMFTRNRAEDFVMLPYTEEMYSKYVTDKQTVMRTVVTYTDEMTKKSESFDVLVTTFKSFSSFEPEYYKEWAKDLDWEESSLIKYPKEDEKIDSVNDLLKELKNS